MGGSVLTWLFAIPLVALGAIVLWVLWEESRLREVHPKRPPGPAWSRKPAPREIWWADVPFAGGKGSKDRKCLVVRTHADSVQVLKITSQDKSRRADHIPIPSAAAPADRTVGRSSWLDTSTLISVRLASFRKRAGACDERTWNQVRMGHRPGWAYKVSLDRRSWWDAEGRVWSPLAADDARGVDVGCGLRVAVGPGGRPVVRDVSPGSVAERAGLRPGFVITGLGGYTSFTLSNLADAIGQPPKNGVRLTVRRNGDGRGADTAVTLPPGQRHGR